MRSYITVGNAPFISATNAPNNSAGDIASRVPHEMKAGKVLFWIPGSVYFTLLGMLQNSPGSPCGKWCDSKHNFAAVARLCFESGPARLCFHLLSGVILHDIGAKKVIGMRKSDAARLCFQFIRYRVLLCPQLSYLVDNNSRKQPKCLL